MSELEFRHVGKGQCRSIVHTNGSLLYSLDSNQCKIDLITSLEAGLGKKLITELLKEIGPDIEIYAGPVTERVTINQLTDSGAIDYVEKTNDTVVIDDEDLLNNFKMIRLFKGGGIKIDYLLIEPYSEGQSIVSIHGIT